MDMNKDLVAASATPLVLAILAEGDSYGYAPSLQAFSLPRAGRANRPVFDAKWQRLTEYYLRILLNLYQTQFALKGGALPIRLYLCQNGRYNGR